MLTQRALEILAKYEILEREMDRHDERETFRTHAEMAQWLPATKRTRLTGIQGR